VRPAAALDRSRRVPPQPAARKSSVSGFAADSLQEGDGFEPSVPRRHLEALPADRVGPPGDHRLATHGSDRIVAEVNSGGDMVGATLRMIDPKVAFTAVRASRGKVVRATQPRRNFDRVQISKLPLLCWHGEAFRTRSSGQTSAIRRRLGTTYGNVASRMAGFRWLALLHRYWQK